MNQDAGETKKIQDVSSVIQKPEPLHQHEKLPAVFPYSQYTKDGVKYSRHLRPLMPLPPQKRGKYDSNDVIHHIKLLPKGSTERAFAITTVAKSGDAKIGKTTIYATLKKLEANNAWVADVSTIKKSKTPTNIKTLGLGYKGYHIESNLTSKNLKWRKSIVLVLQLTPLRFCVKINASHYFLLI